MNNQVAYKGGGRVREVFKEAQLRRPLNADMTAV